LGFFHDPRRCLKAKTKSVQYCSLGKLWEFGFFASTLSAAAISLRSMMSLVAETHAQQFATQLWSSAAGGTPHCQSLRFNLRAGFNAP
jgi:hypothetical protein